MDLRSLYKNNKRLMQLLLLLQSALQLLVGFGLLSNAAYDFIFLGSDMCNQIPAFPHNVKTQLPIKAASYPRRTECSATPLQKPQNFRTVINHLHQHTHIAEINLLLIFVMCICWYYRSNTWNE